MKINGKDNEEMKDWKEAKRSLSDVPKSTYGLRVPFS
jgi:hypothetical protein